MKISIITVCFNAEKSIKTAMESVINQTYKDIEYIIIDGNSTDNTTSIISSYLNYISHFISEPDTGIYNAMNKGIKLAQGDYIYFLNSDDYLIDNRVIEDVCDLLSKNKKIDFLYGKLKFRSHLEKEAFSHDDKLSRSIKIKSQEELLESLITSCLPQPASFANRSLFKKIGLFNENYRIVSDFEWFLYLASNQDIQVAYYDRIIASFYDGGASSNIQKRINERFQAINQVPIYQTDFWLKKQIEKYQNIITSPSGHWGLYRLNTPSYNEIPQKLFEAQKQLELAQAEIAAMKSSKFWKIRDAWLSIKRAVLDRR